MLAAAVCCFAGSSEIDQAKVLGGTAAPVTIELYSSFACVHCKEFHDQLLPLLVRDYVIQGKACVVSREYFSLEAQVAKEAATYATAAARIGKYHQVSDALFRNQQSWMVDGRVWDAVASCLSPAECQKVQAFAKDPKVVAEVQHDLADGAAAKVNGTPTMIITRGSKSYPFPGVPSYKLLSSFLNDLLAK